MQSVDEIRAEYEQWRKKTTRNFVLLIGGIITMWICSGLFTVWLLRG